MCEAGVCKGRHSPYYHSQGLPGLGRPAASSWDVRAPGYLDVISESAHSFNGTFQKVQPPHLKIPLSSQVKWASAYTGVVFRSSPGACAAWGHQRAQARAGLSAPRDSQAGAVSMAWDSTSWPKRAAQTVPFPDRAFLLSCVPSVGWSIARRIAKMKSSEMLLSRPPNVLWQAAGSLKFEIRTGVLAPEHQAHNLVGLLPWPWVSRGGECLCCVHSPWRGLVDLPPDRSLKDGRV